MSSVDDPVSGVRRALLRGEPVDLTTAEVRELPAELFTQILLDAERPQARPLTVTGAQIVGVIDLRASRLGRAVRFTRCEFDSALLLSEATVPSIRLVDCRLVAFGADQLATAGDVDLSSSSIVGGVELRSADIGGAFRVTDASLGIDAKRPALAGRQLRTRRSIEGQRLTAIGGIDVEGAQIGGDLDLRGATLTARGRRALTGGDLRIEHNLLCGAGRDHRFTAEGRIVLTNARVGGLVRFDGARLDNGTVPALICDGIDVAADMLFGRVGEDHFVAQGGIRLTGAHVGGQLVMTGAEVTGSGHGSLVADELRADQTVFLDSDETRRFTATGELRLSGATVDGQLVLNGASLTNHDSGDALNGTNLHVKRDLLCRAVPLARFEARGCVRLSGAHIGGQVSFRGADLQGDGGAALIAERISVDHEMFCQTEIGQPFSADEVIWLVGAHVGGQLGFDDAILRGKTIAIALEEAEVNSLWLRFRERPVGTVTLARARIGRIYDQPYGRPPQWPALALDGCVYDALEPMMEPRLRLRWLAESEHEYSPQPYEQLAAAYRRSGHDDAARQVGIAKEKRRRKTLGFGGKIWSVFLGATVAHGYRQSQALAWLLVLLVCGGLLFGEVYDASEDAARDADLTPAKAQPASFDPIIYSLDLLVPVISVGQRASWNAHGSAQWVAFGLTVLGWLLTAALVAGIGARRR